MMLDHTKVFVIGGDTIDLKGISESIIFHFNHNIEEGEPILDLCQSFSTDATKATEGYEIIDIDTANIAYKNNSMLCVEMFESKEGQVIQGIMFDAFDDANVICIPISQFNMVPDYIFDDYDVLTIWIDTIKNKTRKVVSDTKYLMERLDGLKYLYYTEVDTKNIPCDVRRYLLGTPKERKAILDELS